VREARLEKAGRRCEFVMTTYAPGRAVEERCVRTRRLEVHHNRYDRLGREFPGDLDVFCYFHHLLEHLLQKRCVTCSRPCLEHDEAATAWLLAVLATRRIDPDDPPPVGRRPPKEVFLALVPRYCPTCLPFAPDD
jgi:hypothetical protein